MIRPPLTAAFRLDPRVLVLASLALWLVSGGRAWAHGAYHEVVRQLTAALEKTSDDATLHFRLACAHQEHGELQPALTELARVDQLAPGKFPTRLIRGLAYADARQWVEARKELDAVLAADAGNFRALSERALVLLELNEPTNAIADGRKAMAAATTAKPEFYTRWPQALRTHRQPAEALNVALQALEKLPGDPALLNLALELELEKKDYNSALQRIATLQKIWPLPEPWMRRRAEVLTAAGRPDEARTAWEALRTRLLTQSSLERSTPYFAELLAQSEKALGVPGVAPVLAPPAGGDGQR